MEEAKEKIKKNRIHGITSRWVVGSLLWSIIIVTVAEIAMFYSTRESYYSSAKQALEFRVRLSVSSIPTGLTSPERLDYITSLIENFDEKDRFELMLVNSSGVPVVTSSGFPFLGTEQMNSLSAAFENEDGIATFVGESGNGEKVVAVTELLPESARDIYALRIVSSLQAVDKDIARAAQTLVIVGLLILGFSVYSGSYFIRSIVLPVRKIGASAKRIAGGDFSVRVENRYNDEIGELCDQINEMARGLSETDRIKNEFISSVSHELRTPLTSIKGWAETLENVGPDDRETFFKGIKIMNKETDRLSAMVEELLDFSRISSGMFTLDLETVDLIAELSDSLLTVEERVKKHEIKFSFNEDEQPAIVVADRNRLQQVFVNLLDNAIKYTPKGGKITVTTDRKPRAITVEISDTGVGIPPKDLPNITQRFYKAANSVRGSGIGLAVVDELVRAFGGSFRIKSKLGSGTTAFVTLPLEVKNKPDAEKETNDK